MDCAVLFDILLSPTPRTNSFSKSSPLSQSVGRHSLRSVKRCLQWTRSSSPMWGRRSMEGPIVWRKRCCGRCAHAELELSHGETSSSSGSFETYTLESSASRKSYSSSTSAFDSSSGCSAESSELPVTPPAQALRQQLYVHGQHKSREYGSRGAAQSI